VNRLGGVNAVGLVYIPENGFDAIEELESKKETVRKNSAFR